MSIAECNRKGLAVVWVVGGKGGHGEHSVDSNAVHTVNAGGGWSSHVCTLAHPQGWEKCESARLGGSLKPAKLTVLSANTLDIRRNCRRNHMLDGGNGLP